MTTNPIEGVLGSIRSFTVKKNLSENELLSIVFTSLGAVCMEIETVAPNPKILRFSRLEFDSDMTENERRNAFLKFLSVYKNKKYPRVAIAWSEGMTFRQLSMPEMPEDDLRKAFSWDLKKKYYFNEEENHFGYQFVMDVDGAEGPEKLCNVFYCEKQFANVRLLFLQELGLDIRSLFPGQAALSAFIGQMAPAQGSDVLVCDLDGTLLRILVVREDRNMLARQVSLGTHEFNFTDEILARIAEEIKKTIDFYESQKYFRPITKVILTGDAQSETERIHEYFSKHVETKVVLPELEAFLSERLSTEDRESLLKNPGQAVTGLGVAMLQDEKINLVPDDIKTKNRERKMERWLNLSLITTGLALSLVVAIASMKVHLIKINTQVLQKEHEEISAGKKMFEGILAREKVRRTVFKGEIYSPSLFKEISIRTPSTVTLSGIEYSRQDSTLILRGEIRDNKRESLKSVTQYATALAESLFFASATVTNSSQDEASKTITFEISCAVKALL